MVYGDSCLDIAVAQTIDGCIGYVLACIIHKVKSTSFQAAMLCDKMLDARYADSVQIRAARNPNTNINYLMDLSCILPY